MMPSLSPGTRASESPSSTFAQVLPGSPTESLQSFGTFKFRFKRYVVYISGTQLNILSSPNALVQVVHFKHELVAVAAEDQTGKIVVSDKKDVSILQPLAKGWTEVWWEKTLLLQQEDARDETRWLSWGNDGEVLAGGTRALSLFSTLPSSRSASPNIAAVDGHTLEERRPLWSQPVASPVRQASFSPTASMIASCAQYDRLVKIWRRLSFEDGLFDHTYLPHPGAVTHLQWRPLEENLEHRRGSGVSSRHDEESEVLYTIANDGLLRVWRAAGTSDSEILVLHTTVDLVAAIPQSPSLTIKAQSKPAKAPRFVAIVPSDKFCAAINVAVGVPQSGKVSHSKELLKELISKEPDVVVTFDGQGRMSAWGLQSVGHKRRTEDLTAFQPYHIAHAERLQLKVPIESSSLCQTWFQDNQIHLLVHSFGNGGEISWWQGDVEAFFSTSAGAEDERLLPSATFCGHAELISEIGLVDGGLVSRSASGLTRWQQGRSKLLKARRSSGLTSDVLAATLLQNGALLLTVSSTELSLWDENGKRLAKSPIIASGTGKFRVVSCNSQLVAGVFIQEDARATYRWSVTFTGQETSTEAHLETQLLDLRSHYGYEKVLFATPVAVPSKQFQSCVVTVDEYGIINCLLIPGSSDKGDFGPSASFQTGITNPTALVASDELVAITSSGRSKLTIVDLIDGYVEHRLQKDEAIQSLDCFTPRPRHNLIAVGYPSTVEILVQGRYEHRSSTLPVWLPVRSVSIDTVGLQLTTLAWQSNGSLCLVTGNTMFVTGTSIDLSQVDDKTKTAVDFGLYEQRAFRLLDFAGRPKEPLPLWHPSLVSHILQHGHYGLVTTILRRLAQKLKFWSSGEDLHTTLGQSPETMLNTLDRHDAWLDNDTAIDLREQLEEKDLPGIARAEQQRLKHIIEALAYLRDHVKGLDRNAMRYLFNWKLQLLFADDQIQLPNDTTTTNGDYQPTDFVPDMHWREICFAYHSTSQQALLDILIAHHDNKLTWTVVRKLGIMVWLTEREALEQVFEQAGQTAYRADSPPDPVNAALYYIALHRKPTLLALWRIATWHKEQKSTMNFLKRDFGQPEAKTAAKKNAYALMGKRRFHYAAAFFLLADDPGSATSLLAGQCEDPAFAIAVARLYCGDGSLVLRKLLEDRLVPSAQQDGDRWLLSWCYSVLSEKIDAAEALVRPQAGVKKWHQDDPMTLLLYKSLRTTPSEHEYDAVLRSARILRRMGLWLLALEVVSHWQFKHERGITHPRDEKSNGLTNGAHKEASSMLGDFTSSPPSPPNLEAEKARSMLDDFSITQPAPVNEKAAREAKAAELLAKLKAKKKGPVAAPEESKEKTPKPTQFKEPDPNSLLESFGF